MINFSFSGNYSRNAGGKKDVTVRGILQKFRMNSSEVEVVVVDRAKNERTLKKVEILCPSMIKDIGDETFASFAVKDKTLRIYTK